MGKTLYLECNSGISGDMMVACLLDLGADREVLQNTLDTVPAKGFRVEMKRVSKSGVSCMDFNVILDADHENHDHDMEYLHGHEHSHSHDHSHEHHHGHELEYKNEHVYNHEHPHNHDHNGSHHHNHRGLDDIFNIIDRTEMTEPARNMAKRIFDIVAGAESKAHNVPKNEVHFHEVGAIDSIVDIIAVAVCMDNLDINEVIVPKLCEGQGTVRCQHGILPIPVPAVSNIISDFDLNIEITNVRGELITPTGAAIAAAVKTADKLPSNMRIDKIGMGAGKRNYERPSILRGMIIKDKSSKTDFVYKLESNLDDCTGEALGYVMEKLMNAGARDVHYQPVFMKKSRPGYQLNVICSEEDIEKMENIIFNETTTIGIRRIRCERSILSRKSEDLIIADGTVRLKVCTLPNGEQRAYPEYESVKELCTNTGKSFQEIVRSIYKEISD